MQISDAASGALAQLNHAVTSRAQASMRSASTGDAVPVSGPRNGVERQLALRVIAAEVLQALGGDLGAVRQGFGARALGYGPPDAGGLGAVANALRAALASDGARPADAVPVLLEKVDSGLDSAKQALSALGVGESEIDAAAAEFRDRVGGLVGAEASEPATAAATPEALTAVSARHVRKERGSLELVTQDGDVVRIRFRSRESERVDVAALEAGALSAASARIDAHQSTRIKVDVNGSLDAGELEAIQAFVGQVDALANEFFAGDVEAAFTAGATLQFDAQEIARYSLKLSMTERIEIGALRYAPAAGTALPSRLQPAPMPASATLPNAAPAAPDAPLPATQPAASTDTSIPAVDAAATAPDATPAATAGNDATPPSLLETIRAFVARLLQSADTPLSVGRMELTWSMKIRLLATAIDAARPEPTAAPTAGATLLADTLDNAASQAEKPAAPESALVA
jgi:hypothetical protein